MFEVKKERCGECLFGNNRIVSKGRAKEIISDCKKNDTHFNCHKSKNVCCRGSYDTTSTNLIRASQRMGWVRFV